MVLRRLSILQWSKAYTYTCPNGPYYHWKPMFSWMPCIAKHPCIAECPLHSWMPLHSWIATSSLRHQFPTYTENLILFVNSSHLRSSYYYTFPLFLKSFITHTWILGRKTKCWLSSSSCQYQQQARSEESPIIDEAFHFPRITGFSQQDREQEEDVSHAVVPKLAVYSATIFQIVIRISIKVF